MARKARKSANGKFVIEKDIPMPDDKFGPKCRYPWASMEVGDSVFFKGCTTTASSPANSAHQWAKAHGRRFVSRYLPKEGGVRIWRYE